MGSNKEAQAARNAADRRLREEHRVEWSRLMGEEHEKRGLVWRARPTPEQRAAMKTAQEKAAAAKRIEDIAAKAGIQVEIGDLGAKVALTPEEEAILANPRIMASLQAAKDGTANGVSFDWRGDESGFADEQADIREALADTDDENYQSREDTRGSVARDQAAAPVTE